MKHKILESKNDTFFVKTIFLLEAPLMKYSRKTLYCVFWSCVFCYRSVRITKLYNYKINIRVYADRYQNLQFQNAQKSLFRTYFIYGASNKKMVLTKSLSFLDSNILCLMKKLSHQFFKSL